MPAVVRTLRRRAGAFTAAADPADSEEHTVNGRAGHDAHAAEAAEDAPASSTDGPPPGSADNAADRDDTDDEDAGTSRGGGAAPAGRIGGVAGWSLPAGLGLIGPGADAAARGLLVTAASEDLDDPAARSVVLIPEPTAARLLGTSTGIPQTPGS